MMKRRPPPSPLSDLPDKADAILTADWHLRDTVPICRTDDFWTTLWAKVDFVANLALKYGCPVLHAGDLLHHWKPSPLLLSVAIQHLPRNFWTVYGNHDLPQHSQALSERSGIHTLEVAGALTVLQGAHSGQIPESKHTLELSGRKVVVWHEGVWQGKTPWPGCTARQAKDVLKEFSEFDLIVTGDFHIPCIERSRGRLLVNSGSLMRQSADQIDYRPRVYLWNADANDVTPAYLPIDPVAVSREHLDRVKERDARIEAFVKRLDIGWAAELSFESNLERFLQDHADDIDTRTTELVQKAVAV